MNILQNNVVQSVGKLKFIKILSSALWGLQGGKFMEIFWGEGIRNRILVSPIVTFEWQICC